LRRSQRWASGIGLGVGGTALLASAVAVVSPEPLVGVAWGASVGVLAGAIAAVSVRWALAPYREGEAELIRHINGDGDVPVLLSGEMGPLASAVSQRVRRHEEELRKKDARLEEVTQELAMNRLVLELSRVGLAIVETDEGRITYANPAFRELCHLRGDPVGRVPLEVVPAVEIHEAVQQAIREGTAERGFATGWADLRVRVDKLDAEHVTLRLDDVTREREAERSRSDFVANVSHELRTPITALMGYAETLLLDADDLPASTVSMLQTVERNAKRLRDLFEDLLRLHRIESRRKELPLAKQKLHPLLVAAVIEAIDQAGKRGVDFELDCAEDVEAYCNTEALSAMVSNLARNAVAYSKDNGHVIVRVVTKPGKPPVIEVSDDGIGIAAVHHERIFERFYRVDEARSRRAGGTGLGLAIVKHFALASGCAVEMTSVHGRGSTFTIALPATATR
jgi:two-component system, OmpR family, phosphate regulon sensor histidine kinase PhoR